MALRLLISLAIVVTLARSGFAQASLAKLEEEAFKTAAAEVAPSLVQIQTFGGLDRVGETLTGSGPTTGVAVSADGYVITSAFAFAAKPAAAVVKLPDGRQLDAKIVATDYSRMLTLLKIDAEGLPVPETAPSDEAKIGQWTLAVGKAFDAVVPNTSAGVLSARDRIWGKALQTDAKTSPYNYGGLLVDIRGRAMGVIVPLSMTSDEVMAGADWYDSGIGFAVPFDQVVASFERLKEGGDQHRGTLGLVTTEPGSMFAKPVIGTVREDSPAAEAGVKVGDVIIAVDGRKVSRQAEVLQALGPKYAGDSVELTLDRNGEEVALAIVLEKPVKTSILPEQLPTPQPGEDGSDPQREPNGA
ncbi:MAG: S1C family serine protease [Planctomycetota bacterium]|nr:PDZ domain-containing protein [Planctomycetaceae bacterium]MDQ3330492.1 S1C family serine protease [Planctomycetota bacterium]